MRLRKKQLMDLGASETQAAKFLPALNRLLPANDIDTPRRVTHFLSQVYHESARLKRTEENLNYGADGLRITFGKYYKTKKAAEDHHRKPSKIASHVYANRLGNGDEASGDGWTYRGRGLIQLTGKSNYRAFSGFVGVDCVEAPDLVKDRFPVDSAVFFWTRNNINAKADLDDVRAVTRAINGGLNGLDDRVALLARAKDLLATGEIESLAALETVTHQVSATALNLRSSPVVSPSTRIATLPQGTELQKLPTATKRGWFHVRVVFQQRLQEGYVSASNRYLKRVTVAAPSEPPPVLPELSTPEPRATLPVAHLKENRADITRARDGGRAYPLGEVPRPSGYARSNSLRSCDIWTVNGHRICAGNPAGPRLIAISMHMTTAVLRGFIYPVCGGWMQRWPGFAQAPCWKPNTTARCENSTPTRCTTGSRTTVFYSGGSARWM
ncbi:MAG: SH3 domain-containing protein [Gammaproteobacteria bacterium]|nr:SH3 domain-containing protein [Gammaproteobacteria bacterium]